MTRVSDKASHPVNLETAAQEVAAKASVMMASALSRTGQLNSMNGVSAMDGSRFNQMEVLAQIARHQEGKAREQAEAAAAAVNLPKYYNPSSVNPIRLAEQRQKRKLLWSKKTEAAENENSLMWQTTSMVAGKGDPEAAAKFRKLMGIHGTDSNTGASVLTGTEPMTNVVGEDALRKAQAQADLFSRLEQEYEMSRTITHTHRGMGLGYSAATHIDYSAYAAMKDAANAAATTSIPPTSK